MKIKKIVIEGFGSIVPRMKYKFDRPGLNLILGENGIGKTTIFNALSWCLYGKLLKGKDSSAEPWPSVLEPSFRGTYVSVELQGYKIIRTSHYQEKVHGIKNKGGLFIIESGKLRSERDKRDNQAYINNLIGYSFDLFKNTILFGQKLKRLLEEDGPKKKEIFDEAFESTFILRAREKVEERIKDLKFTHNGLQAEYMKYTALVTECNDTIKGIMRQRVQWRKDQVKIIKEITYSLGITGQQIGQFKTAPSILQDEIDALKIKRDRMLGKVDKDLVGRELKKDIERGQLEQDGENKIKQINKVKRTSDYCQECGQILKGEAKIKHRQSIKSKLTKLKLEYQVIIDRLSSARKEHKELKAKIEEQKNKVVGLKSIEDDLYRKETEHKMLMAHIKRSEEQTKALGERKTLKCPHTSKAFRIKLQAHTELQTKYKKQIDILQKKLSIDEWLIKDPLSNSGLKAFIFDSMLNKVNYYLKGYTRFIGFGVKVYMDLESANKDFKISILRGVQEVPYDDLSGGQKQLADVALIFALNDTVTASKPINILLMDEVFESLSKNNIEIVGQIIERKAINRSIHLITHQNFNPINCYKTFIAYIDPGHTIIDQKYKSA